MRGKHPESFGANSGRGRGMSFRLLSPLLFFAPEVHLAAFEDVFCDDVLNTITWKDFASKMEDSFTEYVAYATILLNANVAYLAIPTINGPSSSSASVVSMVSMIVSLGSIVTGLLLMRWRRMSGEFAEEVFKYLYPEKGNVKFVARRTQRLALLYSLPYALLLWG